MDMNYYFSEFRSRMYERRGHMTPDLRSLVIDLTNDRDLDRRQVLHELLPFLEELSKDYPAAFGPDGMLNTGSGRNGDDLFVGGCTPFELGGHAHNDAKRRTEKNILTRAVFARLGVPVISETRLPNHKWSEALDNPHCTAPTSNKNIALLVHDWREAQKALDHMRPDLLSLHIRTSALGLESVRSLPSPMTERWLDLSRFTKLKVLTVGTATLGSFVMQSGFVKTSLSQRIAILSPRLFNRVKLPPSLQIISMSLGGSTTLVSAKIADYLFDSATSGPFAWLVDAQYWTNGSFFVTSGEIIEDHRQWLSSLKSNSLPNLRLMAGSPLNLDAPNIRAAFVDAIDEILYGLNMDRLIDGQYIDPRSISDQKDFEALQTGLDLSIITGSVAPNSFSSFYAFKSMFLAEWWRENSKFWHE